jgi:hypothetical protein
MMDATSQQVCKGLGAYLQSLLSCTFATPFWTLLAIASSFNFVVSFYDSAVASAHSFATSLARRAQAENVSTGRPHLPSQVAGSLSHHVLCCLGWPRIKLSSLMVETKPGVALCMLRGVSRTLPGAGRANIMG